VETYCGSFIVAIGHFMSS